MLLDTTTRGAGGEGLQPGRSSCRAGGGAADAGGAQAATRVVQLCVYSLGFHVVCDARNAQRTVSFIATNFMAIRC